MKKKETKKIFKFEGKAFYFGRDLGGYIILETQAVSEKSAKRNFLAQIKKMRAFELSAGGFTLHGTITEVEEAAEEDNNPLHKTVEGVEYIVTDGGYLEEED